MSTFAVFGLPDLAAATLFFLSIIATATPYLAGKDIGSFSIPDLSGEARYFWKYAGPIAILLCLLCFFPCWSPDRSPTIPKPAAALPLEVDDSNFNSVLDSSMPVLVEFWDYKPGSQNMRAIVKRVSDAHNKKITTVKYCIIDEGNIVRIYGVSSCPTFILFENGRPIGRIDGASSETELNRIINAKIAK